MLTQLKNIKSMALLAAVLAVGSPLRPALGQEGPRSYDDTPATSRAGAADSSVDRDRTNRDAARQRLDQIVAARERAQRDLDALKGGVNVSSDPAQARADLDHATADREDLRGQLKSIEQKLTDAQAKADRAHEDAMQRFDQREDVKAASADFDRARMDLKTPTDRVLDQLQQTREFMELVDAARAAKQAEDRLAADKTADPKALRDAEQAFITADNKVQEQEEKALTADPDVVAGRKQVDAARDRLRALRDPFEQDLQKDAAFAALVDDVRQQQAALDAGNDDLKKLDARIAAAKAVVDGQPASLAMQPDPKALSEAQARLDQINRDYDQTRRDLDGFNARPRDGQGADVARGGEVVTSDAQPIRERVVERVVEEPVYTPVYGGPAYDPFYAYGDAYYSTPYIGLSFSYADYCARPRCYYGYSGYYGGCYGGYWGLYASYYYNHDHYYRGWHDDYRRGGWDRRDGDRGYGRGYARDYGRDNRRDYGRGGSYAYGRSSDRGGSSYYGGGLRSSGREYSGRTYSGISGSSFSGTRSDRSGYGGAYSGYDRARLSTSTLGSSRYSSSSPRDYGSSRSGETYRGGSGGRSSSSGAFSAPSYRSLSHGETSTRSSAPYASSSYRSGGSSFSSHSFSGSGSSHSYRSPTFQQQSFRSSSSSSLRSGSHSSGGGGGVGSSHFSSGGSSGSHSTSSGSSSSGGGHSHGGR